jgi:hypothetical protein
LAAGAIFLFYFFDRFLSLFFKVFVTDSLHQLQLQLNFSNDLSNMPTSVVQLKKSEVDPNFTFFTKQQKRCFTIKHFELSHEVQKKYPAFAIG